MLTSHEYRLMILGMITISILILASIVIAVLYFMNKFKKSGMQKGFEEEEHLVPVPGYDDD